MLVPGRAVLAAALLWIAAGPALAADDTIVIHAPSAAPVQGREGADIQAVGGPTINTGALGLVLGQPVYAIAPGRAEVTVRADQWQRAVIELSYAAMKGCEPMDLDVKPAMRQLEKGPWAPFLDTRVSEETGQSEKLLLGETAMTVTADGPSGRSKTIQFSMAAHIQNLDGVRTRSASCGILMLATDETFPVDWIAKIFEQRRLGAPEVFPGGEVWRLGPPGGVTWPEGRHAKVNILRSSSAIFSVNYLLYEPVVQR